MEAAAASTAFFLPFFFFFFFICLDNFSPFSVFWNCLTCPTSLNTSAHSQVEGEKKDSQVAMCIFMRKQRHMAAGRAPLVHERSNMLMQLYMRTCVHTYMRTCVHTYMHTYNKHTQTGEEEDTSTRPHGCFTNTRAKTHACVHACMYASMHAHIHTCTHMHAFA